MENNKRQHPRFEFCEPVGYHKPQQTPHGSLASNISQGGVKLTVYEFIPIGSMLEMQVQLPDLKTVNVKGRVMWVNEIAYSERYEIGVQFIPQDVAASTIGDYIKSRRF